MDLAYPDFLRKPFGCRSSSISGPPETNWSTSGDPLAQTAPATSHNQILSPSLHSDDFDTRLSLKLATLDTTSSFRSPFGPQNSGQARFLPNHSAFRNTSFDPFSLPMELQGGVGTISSRRPSYAAESFTRAGSTFLNSTNKNSLATFAAHNNYNLNAQTESVHQLTASFPNFSLDSNFSEFQQRRPSQVAALNHTYYVDTATYQDTYSHSSGASLGLNRVFSLHIGKNLASNNTFGQFNGYNDAVNNLQSIPPLALVAPNLDAQIQISSSASSHNQFQYPPLYSASRANYSRNEAVDQGFQSTKLDDGLILKDQKLVALSELRALYAAVHPYFIKPQLASTILQQLQNLGSHPLVMKLVAFLKSSNNLNFSQKVICLVANKNGKLDLLQCPSNTNLSLQKDDLVIVDGDRGKDMVMILDPNVPPSQAALFNFLKKREHLRSLNITDNLGGTVVKGLKRNPESTDFEKNEDNEFVILLPTKQVLRFATPKVVFKLSGKFLGERKAFQICAQKIQELGLGDLLELINVEYQSDFKKLIFYYYANFKRIDFRVLIKELFKIYKTRIWMCAVLPSNAKELYSGDTVKSAENWHPVDFRCQTAANLEMPNKGTAQDRNGAHNQAGADSSIRTNTVSLPPEYNLTPEQLANLTIQNFLNLPEPTYFHLHNMLNLMANLFEDIRGHFYGMNAEPKTHQKA